MPVDGSQPYDIIATVSDLQHLAAALERETVIAVDLEADSMYHYQEKVCLLQLATATDTLIVDPIAIQDLSALKPVFRNAEIRKVFHGADYDVRSLYRDFDIRISNLFDTQVACRFLGLPETGLEAVLRSFFGVSLNKKYQRKDWSRRPLPKEMLAYAAADVRHLVPLAQSLEAQLESAGRTAWASEECRLLSRVRPAAAEEKPLFLSCKGAGRLDPRGLAVLENLLRLRLELARDKDRPLFKVFNSEALVALAEAKPSSVEEIERTGALAASQVKLHGRSILAAVRKALNLPPEQLPHYPHKKHKTVSAPAAERIQVLRRWREAQARRLKLDPSLICSKAAMIAIAERRPTKFDDLAQIEELRQWQRRAFGKDIIAALQR